MDERIDIISEVLKNHQGVLNILAESYRELSMKLLNDYENLNSRLELLNTRVRTLECINESAQHPSARTLPIYKEPHEEPVVNQKEVEELHAQLTLGLEEIHAQLMLELEEFRRNTP